MLEGLDLSRLPIDPALLPQFDLLASALLLLLLWVARKMVVRSIRARSDLAPQDQRRLISSTRTIFLLLMLLGLAMIWAPQLRTFALSLTAVAVAIVVATKELILCLSGAVLRATTRAFAVGDWIEVGESRGEVTDHTVLATTLQEFGVGTSAYVPTGRIIVVPNSLLLTAPVRNQSAMRDFTYHSFAVTLDPMPSVEGAHARASEIVRRHYETFREEAAEANAMIERRTHSDLPDPAPLVRFRTSDLGKLRVEVTLFCRAQAVERLEREITLEFLAAMDALRLRAEKAGSSQGEGVK